MPANDLENRHSAELFYWKDVMEKFMVNKLCLYTEQDTATGALLSMYYQP
jgi:hypothetical protein